jgi:hypothetical protein
MRSKRFIENNILKYQLQYEKKLDYTFPNGKTISVGKHNIHELNSLSEGELQALSRYLAKYIVRPKPQALISEQDDSGRSQTDIPIVKEIKNDNPNFEIIRNILKKIQKEKEFYEEKMHIPYVFRGLLTQPHTAFDQTLVKKEFVREKCLLIVDQGNGYWKPAQQIFHQSFVDYQMDIPGWDKILTWGEVMRKYSKFQNNNWTNADDEIEYVNFFERRNKKLSEKYDKILYISQGCGHNNFQGMRASKILKKMIFATCFSPKENCGCKRIHNFEQLKVKIIYNCGDPNHFLASL